jgi:hypothetical protein
MIFLFFYRIDKGPNASMPPQCCETAVVATAAAVGARDCCVLGPYYVCFVLIYSLFHQRPRWHRPPGFIYLFNTPPPHYTSDCQGFQNPQGSGVGYVGVRVGVEISIPLTNPYPQSWVRGIDKDKNLCKIYIYFPLKPFISN